MMKTQRTSRFTKKLIADFKVHKDVVDEFINELAEVFNETMHDHDEVLLPNETMTCADEVWNATLRILNDPSAREKFFDRIR